MSLQFTRIFRVTSRLLNTIKAQNRQRTLVAKWSNEPDVVENWGDKLNPYLIAALSGKYVFHQSQVYSCCVPAVHWVIGSSLGRINSRKSVIWGAGFLFTDEGIPVKPRAIHAVRGYWSQKKLMEQDIIQHDVPVGDPALLMPLLYYPGQEPVHEIGIIPHFRERDVPLVQALRTVPECKVIDVCGGLEEFCHELLSCRLILSSSLHGLIAAHAYGIPAMWLRLSDRPRGDGFKFYDYLSSVGLESAYPTNAETVADILKLAQRPAEIGVLPSIAALLDACPFIAPDVLVDLKSKIRSAYQGRG
jgi:pyruvyltransferase